MYTAHDGVVYRRENRDVPSVDGALATMCLNIDSSDLVWHRCSSSISQTSWPLSEFGSWSSEVQETQLMCRTRRLEVRSAYRGDKFNPRVVHALFPDVQS